MKRILNYHNYYLLFASFGLAISCTKLEENLTSGLTPDQISAASSSTTSLLKGAYVSMRSPYQGMDQVWALTELSTDEMMAPTRGGDWDDNGVWRVLHQHAWDAENIHIRDCFNNLGGVIYTTTNFLAYSPTTAQAAESRFLRAFAMFDMLDLFNQVPYRAPLEAETEMAKVRVGTEALNYIIGQVKDSVLPYLPTTNAITQANIYAAKTLLMKCYLNRGVFANRASPTFASTDMDSVVTLANEIISSGQFSFSSNYFDNFAPANGSLSKENIFTAENTGGVESGALSARWNTVHHYNQTPSGWNGWVTLSDFYNKFESTDIRRGTAYATGVSTLTNPGSHINVGFLIGQQYSLYTGAALTDRTGAALIFTAAVNQIETGTNLEVTGIRPTKYVVDYVNTGSGIVDNDFVYYRYPDVLLMKAEAILRGGTGTTAQALTLVNSIRTNRGATKLSALTLDVLLDERGRELYLESCRRQDLIRFGKFMIAWQEKTADASTKYLLYPIPNQQIAVNTNYTQNAGY